MGEENWFMGILRALALVLAGILMMLRAYWKEILLFVLLAVLAVKIF